MLVRNVCMCTLLLAANAICTAQEVSTFDGEELVVIGTRGTPRIATESMAPVDVFTGEELRQTGLSDLSRALQQRVPSLNFGAAVNAGGAANSRGPTLRGLGQDQVLVLIDGKRRHGSSLINFNNTIGRGQVPVDLNLVPLSAIERVEILRDGAAAQYGSDAIAGIINIVLADDADGISGQVQGSVTEQGDGESWDVSGRAGTHLGDGGTLTFSAQGRDLGSMNRAGVDSRFARVTNQQGEDGRRDLAVALNAKVPLQGAWQTFANATFATRDSHNTLQYRAPTISPVLYPNGFLPRANLDLTDYGGTLGLRGAWNEWQIELSDTAGVNKADYTVTDTVNTSLGAASPTRFDAGGARYFQNLIGVTFSRALGVLAGMNVAAGIEHRHENYELRRGQPESFTGTGSQGFAGFNPPIPVDASRDARSAYVDSELSLTQNFRLGAAVRYEDYDAAGDETTGKISAFWQVLEPLALRATASSGFRAPSLQQSYFSSVTSQSVNGVLQTVGTFAVNDPVALALGASALKPETSQNFSIGMVWRPHRDLTFSVDAYRIDIDDRIVLSETLSGAPVLAILRSAGITSAQSARFFTNAVDTRTDGLGATADWHRTLRNSNRVSLTFGYDSYDTDITRLRPNAVLPNLALLGRSSIDLLARAQPRDKLNLTGAWSNEVLGFTVDVVRYGEFSFVPVTNEQTFGAEIVGNVTAEWRLADHYEISAGILNVTDNYADMVAERALTQGGSLLYPEAGGMGFEGRQYFLRLSASF